MSPVLKSEAQFWHSSAEEVKEMSWATSTWKS